MVSRNATLSLTVPLIGTLFDTHLRFVVCSVSHRNSPSASRILEKRSLSFQLLVPSSQNSGTVERIGALDLVVTVTLIRASLIPRS
jgi:hypothetical protein